MIYELKKDFQIPCQSCPEDRETGDQPRQCNEDLSEARRRLAIEFLADVMILKPSPIRHVLGY